MAASPPIKIYRNGAYVASAKYFEDAAALAGMTKGTVIKWLGRHLIWTEGTETIAASESWDEAAAIMRERVAQLSLGQDREAN